MRNENGGWILGSNKFLGNCLILNAELWDILDGLKLILQRGYNKVVIQLDSLEVVKVIHRSISKISNSALIRRIHHILTQESQWILRYIHREENQSADYLAKLAFEIKEDLQLVETLPVDALEFLK
ncbi:hypothetical protein Goari_026711, partial [Gossypium aridum]|nr:hypothetical protein [Gossypium aridum]